MGEDEKDTVLTKERELFIQDVIQYFNDYAIDEDSKHYASEILEEFFNKYRWRDLRVFNRKAKEFKKIINRAKA